jgi:hypothetical protein
VKRTPLKPGKGLERKTSLSSRASLTSQTPMKPGNGLTRRPPVPSPREPSERPPVPRQEPRKAKAVTPEERRAKRIVKARSGGFCEMGCGMPAVDWSHRRSVAQGGQWRPSNGLHACRRCHAACEVTAPLLADLGGWRIVHRDPDPATAPVYLQARKGMPAGWYFLNDDGGWTPGPSDPVPAWFPWMPRPISTRPERPLGVAGAAG